MATSNSSKVEIKTYFGQCKCCLNYAYLKNMWEQHCTEGVREIYGKMLVDCFCISWTIKDTIEDDKICEECIIRLRDAASFKKLVIKSQEKFEDSKVKADAAPEGGCVNKERGSKGSFEDQKDYQDVEFLEEEILEVAFQDDDSQASQDSQPETKKRKWPKRAKNKTYKQYTEDQLKTAVEAVKSKEMTVSEAAQKYEVPRKTIGFKAKIDDNENLDRKRKSEFIKEIKSILTYTNATPFKNKGTNYYCIFCSADSPAFEDPQELRTHTHTTHTDKVKRVEFTLRPHYNNEMLRLDVQNLACVCGVKGTWHEMIDHLKSKHEVALEESKTRIVPYTLSTPEMSCALCDYYSNFSNIHTHMNTHYNNYICGECGDTYITIARLNCHMKIHKIGAFPCKLCNKVFSREMYRKRHVDYFHDKKLVFKCPHCEDRFSTETLRYNHMQEKHKEKLESKAKICRICDKSFSWGSPFAQHMRRYHGLSSHTCDECGRSFDGQKLLNEHKLRHTGIRKFNCDICHKSYFSEAAVAMHKKWKHNERAERSEQSEELVPVEVEA